MARAKQWKIIKILIELGADVTVEAKAFLGPNERKLTFLRWLHRDDQFEILTDLHEQREEKGYHEIFKKDHPHMTSSIRVV